MDSELIEVKRQLEVAKDLISSLLFRVPNARWDGECDIAAAFLVPSADGEPTKEGGGE